MSTQAAICTIDAKIISSVCTTHNKTVAECRHMPTRKFTETMVAAAIAGFEEQKRQIDAEIAELRAMGKESGPAESGKAPRRKLSAASRKKMALAQQKRWAAKKTVSKPEATVAEKPKRKLSAAGKKRIIEASKKYWAEKRAVAKKFS
jgi:hypothetical protein